MSLICPSSTCWFGFCYWRVHCQIQSYLIPSALYSLCPLDFVLPSLSYSFCQKSIRRFLHYRFRLRSRCIRRGIHRNLSRVLDHTVLYQLTLVLGSSSLLDFQNIGLFAHCLDYYVFGVGKQYLEFSADLSWTSWNFPSTLSCVLFNFVASTYYCCSTQY